LRESTATSACVRATASPRGGGGRVTSRGECKGRGAGNGQARTREGARLSSRLVAEGHYFLGAGFLAAGAFFAGAAFFEAGAFLTVAAFFAGAGFFAGVAFFAAGFGAVL